MSKIVEANEKIAQKVVEGYKKIEDGVVGIPVCGDHQRTGAGHRHVPCYGGHRQRPLCMILGIVVGLVGIVLVILAYPVYNNVVKKEREKIAPEIIRLTDELMK